MTKSTLFYPPKGTGRRPVFDPRRRLWQLSEILVAPEPVPLQHYWPTSSLVLDQDDTPQCVGYSWRDWMSAKPLMTKGGPTATEIYRGAQDNDYWAGNDYEGSSVDGGAKWLQQQGLIKERRWANTVDDMRIWLAFHGTLVAGTTWWSDMSWPELRRRGEFWLRVGGQVQGGHAYHIIGYSDVREAFRMRNSWGPAWAQRGRAWISYRDMEQLIQDVGEICAAVEQRAA